MGCIEEGEVGRPVCDGMGMMREEVSRGVVVGYLLGRWSSSSSIHEGSPQG